MGWLGAALLATAIPGLAQPPSHASSAPHPGIDLSTAVADAGVAWTRGGTLTVHWNHELAERLGIVIVDGGDAAAWTLRLGSASVAGWTLLGRGVRAPIGLEWTVAEGAELRRGATRLALQGSAWRRAAGDPPVLVGSADGATSLFRLERLMFDLDPESSIVRVRSADLRLTSQAAAALGIPEAADLVLAGATAELPVERLVAPAQPRACGDPNWPGEPAPAGGTYQADVLLAALSMQFTRCDICDGPGGNNARIVFTPDATLVNNVNQGSPAPTIPGDPLGTSSALWTADVPWYTKFQAGSPFPPYGNDQHPYLIWNLYRIEADGAITQIGRSALKHAFSTSNFGENCEGCNGNNVLGRACGDTYPQSSNDFGQALGPRSELIPFTGQWGRCGSIYDPNCDGVGDTAPVNSFDQRMLVRESAIDPAANPGATYLVEAWYVVRDDIRIENTMGTRPVSFAWIAPSFWNVTNQTPFRLGPAVDRWIEPLLGPAARSTTLSSSEGRARVAARTVDLGAGQRRYDFVVMNLDFSRPVTQGAEPNLRVLRNLGFDRFGVVRAPDAPVVSTAFADGDIDAANDWTVVVGPESITWTAPSTAASLGWGAMMRFTVVAFAPPGDGTATLRVAEPGSPAAYAVPTFSIGTLSFFADGFEDAP